MTAAIVASGLAAGYQATPVWSKATFTIDECAFVAILGPNGSGKSTLLSLLLGLRQPLAGTLEVFGAAPERGSAAIGYVPQSRAIDLSGAISGRELVALGLDGHRYGFGLSGKARRTGLRLVDDAISSVGATAYAARPVGAMSGGERQRLLLAQALLGDPRLLLLDEPLANLDVRQQAEMAELVHTVGVERHITVLLVAHDVNPLRTVIDRVCYVAGGKVAVGSPEEIITSASLSELYGAPVEVLEDSRGRRFVVGLDEEVAHPHGDHDHRHGSHG